MGGSEKDNESVSHYLRTDRTQALLMGGSIPQRKTKIFVVP